uniref:CSON013660 protein n=1 Tax=Culicoides sonorensis TaxID=179676 RepID=A0A336LHC3_CULSO
MGEKEEVIDNEFDPIIWDERGNTRLQDLPVTMIQDSLDLLKKFSIKKNPLWINLGIDNDDAVIEEYCTRLLHILKDCCSIAAISIDTGKLLGLALCKIMSIDEYDWTLWKIMPTESKKLEKIFTLQYDIIKTSDLNKGTCFHCFDLCVSDEIEEENFEEVLLKQAYEASKSLKTDVFSYTCFTKEEASKAVAANMHLSKDINYAFYTDSVGERIFKDIEKEPNAYLFIRSTPKLQDISKLYSLNKKFSKS